MEEVFVPSKVQVNISNKKESGKPNTIREKYQACSSLPQELESWVARRRIWKAHLTEAQGDGREPMLTARYIEEEK